MGAVAKLFGQWPADLLCVRPHTTHWVGINLGIGTILLQQESDALKEAQEEAERERAEILSKAGKTRTISTEL